LGRNITTVHGIQWSVSTPMNVRACSQQSLSSFLAAATVGFGTMIVPAVCVVCGCVHDTLGESSNRGSAARSSAATFQHWFGLVASPRVRFGFRPGDSYGSMWSL